VHHESGSQWAGVDWLYGRHSVHEALRAGRRRVHRVLIAHGAHGLDSLVGEAQRLRVQFDIVERHELERVVGSQHQGVAAEADGFAYAHLDELVDGTLLLALDSLQDPQNFGTLLRTALAVGADGVILPEHRAVSVTPAVSKASAGAVEHLRVARVTNLARALRQLKSHDIWAYGLDAAAPQTCWDTDLRGRVALVVGSEGSGLGRLVAEVCDALVAIPMRSDRVASLNAAVAGSIVLYEVLRQRATTPPGA
jgi:23S rRNA (guanosine2251-2'-O)-methyltransferase